MRGSRVRVSVSLSNLRFFEVSWRWHGRNREKFLRLLAECSAAGGARPSPIILMLPEYFWLRRRVTKVMAVLQILVLVCVYGTTRPD